MNNVSIYEDQSISDGSGWFFINCQPLGRTLPHPKANKVSSPLSGEKESYFSSLCAALLVETTIEHILQLGKHIENLQIFERFLKVMKYCCRNFVWQSKKVDPGIFTFKKLNKRIKMPFE